jgi:hypothetical protein
MMNVMMWIVVRLLCKNLTLKYYCFLGVIVVNDDDDYDDDYDNDFNDDDLLMMMNCNM